MNRYPPSHSERMGKQVTWQKASRPFIYSSGKQRQGPPCIEWEYGSPSLSQGFTLDDYLTTVRRYCPCHGTEWQAMLGPLALPVSDLPPPNFRGVGRGIDPAFLLGTGLLPAATREGESASGRRAGARL